MAIDIPQLLQAVYQIKAEDSICNPRGDESKFVRPTFIMLANNTWH
jgi:hypothetical protein